jgi:hypothetical protein
MTFSVNDASTPAYLQAWGGLAIVFFYYVAATIILHWTRVGVVAVTKYEPPGLSPGVAGYLFENGRRERAFAATLVSLAVKGYIEIRQKSDWFTFKRLREPDESLAPEEFASLSEIFSGGIDVYKFDGREHSRVFLAFQKFEKIVNGIADPSLISSHRLIWAIGVGCLVIVAGRLWVFLSFVVDRSLENSIFFLSLTTGVGGFCLVGALRAWPATLRKLASFLPNSKGPKRPLGWNDMFPVWLTASASLAFGFLAVVMSLRFATFIVACALLGFTFRHALEAPTAKGRKLLSELWGFRDFLSRAESDRLDRDNEAGLTPKVFQRYIAYAVALDVERGWGEQFAEDLLEMIQFDQAIAFKGPPLPDIESIVTRDLGEDDSIIQLNLGSRK